MASKKKKLPPWGDLFDGKPIKRWWPRSDPIYGGPDKDALDEQFKRMCGLKEHYGIPKDRGWYRLALAIASELDASLTIIDPPPPPSGKTAQRWRGAEGVVLLEEFKAQRNAMCRGSGARRVKQEAVLSQLHMASPRYRGMPFASFKTAFHYAKRQHKASGSVMPKKVRSKS